MYAMKTNNSSLAECDASVIRAELDRLLSDRRFSGARQMSAFLRYIVCETLEGNGSRIKAYTVGVDALGKPDDFDAQADPSVRVLALRLRKTLALAYEDNSNCLARVVLRVGTYVPEFYKPEAFAEPETQTVLQSPDHASVSGTVAGKKTEGLSADIPVPATDSVGLNRVSNAYSTDSIHRMPVSHRGPVQGLLSKNTVAFTSIDMLPKVVFTTLFFLLALLLVTPHPVQANVHGTNSPSEVSSVGYQNVESVRLHVAIPEQSHG